MCIRYIELVNQAALRTSTAGKPCPFDKGCKVLQAKQESI